METKIKICGIRRADEVAVINDFPISYAGFIFAKSKRQVTADQCNELVLTLRNDIKKVGVFVDEDINKVLEIVKTCHLDVVQLHGNESVDYIKKIPVPVWKTIQVKDEASLVRIGTYKDDVEGILFETYHEKLKGGTGKTFDWHLLDEVDRSEGYQMILAGGINPGNAKEAIEIVKPSVLDVNSGLEEEGFKTRNKVEELFKELTL